MIMLMVITLIFIFAFFVVHKIPSKRLKNMLKIVLIIVAMEIYIFNINSFRMICKSYKKEKFTPEQLKMTYIKYNEESDTYELEKQTSCIEIENLNFEVATIKLNIENENKHKLEYSIGYTDQTSVGQYRELPSKILTNDVEKSKIVVCYLSGNSPKIRINFKQDENEENSKIKINDITINEEINLFENISISRMLVLIIISILIYMMFTEKMFNMPYDEKNDIQSVVLLIVIISFVVIVEWITITTGNKTSNIYDEFVNALTYGKVSLLETPSNELLNLSNPYDLTLRKINTVSYIWDVALYNNKYYVYFGILPFLILPVPFIKLFNIKLDPKIGILLFSIITIVALSKLIILLYRKWFGKVKFSYLVLAIIGTLSGSLIFWVNRRPDVYEYVLTAAMCFSTLGIYFFFKAIEKEVNYKYLTLSAICLASTVACRPTNIFVSLIIFPKVIQIFIKNVKEKRNIVKLICAIGIPYFIIGIGIMIYNYVRFDNVFEFGARYQLTINDVTNLKYRIMTIPSALITQLFALPSTTQTFPFFIHNSKTAIPFYGYCYTYANVCGLFILNPINYILIFLLGLRKKIKEKKVYDYTIILVLVACIICIVNITCGGVMQRYAMDYAWILNVASYLTLFMIVSNIKSEEIKKYILKIAIVITLFMFVVNFIVGGIVSESNLLELNNPKVFYTIRYLICFWE